MPIHVQIAQEATSDRSEDETLNALVIEDTFYVTATAFESARMKDFSREQFFIMHNNPQKIYI